MQKYLMLILLLIGSGLAVYYSLDAVFVAQANKPVPPAENELRITAKDFEFDQTEYRIAAGETKVLTLINQSGRHGVEVKGLDIDLQVDAPVEFTFDTPGEYELICNLMCGLGHNDMVAKLIVE